MVRILMKDHLRNSQQPTDITFVFRVLQGHGTDERKHMYDIVFPAHRDRLLAASPFFECLLAGSRHVDGTMLSWNPTDDVSIEDCQPGAFRVLLRC